MTHPKTRRAVLRLAAVAWLAAFAASAATATAAPVAPIRALEQALETRSGALLLPGGGVGTLTVTPCAGCRPLSLLAGGTTAWMIGGRAVGFEELRRLLGSDPRIPVMVFYDGRSQSLTRLVVRGGAQQASP